MNRVLLDTHVAVWAAFESKRISKPLRRLFDKTHEAYVSSISLAEIEMKQSEGKVKIKSVSVADIDKIGFQVMAFDAEAAFSMSRFEQLANHDPFDWLLLAQAASLDATFVTADRKLLSLDLEWVFDARD